jgi:hypothetical protein
MKNNRTEIVFLLDRSGSMAGMESDTIGGFNSLLTRQRQLEGETSVTAVLFDDEYEVLWSGVDADGVKLTENEYYVRGCTALLDAVGKTILEVRNRLFKTCVESRPNKVLFVITTDGLENASREFSYEKVKEMIEEQKANAGWEFLFIGANIDVAKEANNLGISEKNAYQFEASQEGVEEMYSMINEELSVRRKG